MTVQYANLASRLLLRGGFAYQFAFPVLGRRRAATVLEMLEKCLPKPRHPEPIKAPIFVVGLPRTGSTWLQTLLCAHPDIAYISHFTHHTQTCFRAANLVARVLGLDARGERFIGDSIVHSLHSPSEATLFWGQWFGMDPVSLAYNPVHASDLDAATRTDIMETLARVTALFGPGKRLFAKNPAFIPYVPLLAELFPDARFIHLVRDPRPTANSMLKLLRACRRQLAHIKASGRPMARQLDDFIPYPRLPRLEEYVGRFGADDLRTTARLWRDATLFMQECAPAIPNLLTVRFESVLAAPEATVGRILEFCGLAPVPALDPTMAQLFDQTGKISHVNSYGDFDVIGALCRETMPLLGYDPDGPVGAILPSAAPAFDPIL